MRILTDNQFNDLKQKAEGFDKIVNTIVEASENVEASTVTADTVIEVITAAATPPEHDASEDKTPELNARITQLESDIKTSQDRVTELEAEINQTPGAESAIITSTGEPSGKAPDILDFAKKHEKDPFAVLAEAEKQGYL